MARHNDIIIPQKEIDTIFTQKKIVNFNGILWRKKQIDQPAPAWLELLAPVLNEHSIPIEHLRIQFQYRPARRIGLTPSISLIAFYKNRRLFAVDQGENLTHNNRHIDVEPPAQYQVTGCHFHLLHEKYNQETGYVFDELIQRADDFHFFADYFLRKFNVTAVGQIPHPIYSSNGQLELL